MNQPTETDPVLEAAATAIKLTLRSQDPDGRVGGQPVRGPGFVRVEYFPSAQPDVVFGQPAAQSVAYEVCVKRLV